ncbi:MAG: glycosyltransferase family 4 protein [Candidatus Bathyarchaeia archaeon]|jgi:glycosyltransferase involved in cell wall biosynthesis
MKVALISHEGGGISSVTSGLAKSLHKKGIKVTVFTGVASSAPSKKKGDENFEIVQYPIPDVPPRNIWFQILNYNSLTRSLREFDLIHGVSPYASFGLTYFKNNIRRPFVSTIHDSHRYSRKAFLNQPFSSWTLSEIAYNFGAFPLYDYPVNRVIKYSDKVTMCSYSLLANMSAYRKIDFRKVFVIQNGVDIEEIDSIPESRVKMKNDVSIVYGGRLFWTKGSLLLVKAFERLSKDFDNVHLTIFGKGPLKKVIERYIENSSLEKKIDLPGYVSHKAILSEIKKADIVAFPSVAEAQPMFILESMACRKPVVAFDFSFAREVIKDMDTGLLAKPLDIEDFSKKLGILVADGELREKIGLSAYNHAKLAHNWDIQAEEYLKVYQKALER